MRIESEVTPLKKVIVHRPGAGLKRLTPANCHDYLFDDVLWPERAVQEHDAFTDILRDHQVEVFYLEELLIETLADSKLRTNLLEKLLRLVTIQPQLHILAMSLTFSDFQESVSDIARICHSL